MPLAARAGSPGGPDGPAQRRSAPVRAGQPWRIRATGGSVSRGGRCWQSHQVPPGQSS